ncbi:TonB-dependent receptor domain-containing protein [Nguyenibacter sp. L1]|uniref:TonB-dependent receptor plug domain-containing protein n=1 Tax=Nguyenibacter sp. L1 TaxID=3049350 RepID=UPI002B488E24|nr:TonB-dependent receptor [Nguyenibacter sp. L1]WRH89779.1 TonB-dependent receptor [Nguyenibacter sp. L1]
MMFVKKLHSVLMTTTALTVGLGWCQVVQAQTVASPPSTADEAIQVMGSHLPGNSARSVTTQAHSTTQVFVVTAQELKATGQTNVMAAIAQLSPSVSSPAIGGSGVSGFTRTMTLRNLNADETLILVNGKRRHLGANFLQTAGGTDPSDISLIPMSAIDHVEIITEGATALYGQDAIGGAVNIILKTDNHGGSFTAQNSGFYAGDGQAIDITGDYGFKLGKQGGYLNLAGQFTNQLPSNRSGAYSKETYFPLPNGSPDPRAAILGTDLSRNLGVVRSQLETFSANGAIPISEGAEFYTTDTYSHRDGWVPEAYRPAADDETVREIHPNGMAPYLTMTENDFQINNGFRGSLGKWSWDVYTNYGRDQQRYGMQDSDNPTYGLQSQTNFYDGTNIASDLSSGFKVSRHFDTGFLPKPLNLEFGGEYRHDTFQLTPGDLQSWSNGGILILGGPDAGKPASAGAADHSGTPPSLASSAGRDVFDGHANLDFFVLPNWEWTLGGRVVNYSDTTTVSTGSIGTRYNINKRWAIRGSVNTGYRPPTLAQLNYYSAAQGPTYTTVQLPSDSVAARALGSSGLKGEYSRSYSVGLDATPVDNWHITANLYRIAINDRLADSTQFGGPVLEGVLGGIGFPNVQFASYYTNPVNTVTNGGDVSTDYTLHLQRYGTLRLAMAINFADTEITHFNQTPSQLAQLGFQYFNAVSQNTLEHQYPKNSENISANWKVSKFSIFAQEQRFGSYTYILSPGLPENDWSQVHPGFITNVELGYDVLPRLHIAVGANNLFNKYPTMINRALDIKYQSGIFTYPQTSPYGFNGGMYYVKGSWTF